MAYKMFKRERRRQLKAKRLVRSNCAFPYRWCSWGTSSIYSAALPRWHFVFVGSVSTLEEARAVQAQHPGSIIQPRYFQATRKKVARTRYFVKYARRTGAAFRVEAITWPIQDADTKHRFATAKKFVGRSAKGGHTGTAEYKDKYTRLRRSETRQLEHAALFGDEEAFDRIAPDGWRGAISWDIW